MSLDPLLVTARLASPLAGDPPHLDALLEWALSLYRPKAEPGYKIDRRFAAPPMAEIPIPLQRSDVGPWKIACASSPILPIPTMEAVEHIGKKIGVEHAGLLAEKSRIVVATGNSWTKSYRIPLRIRTVDRVAWFAVGNRREILKILQRHILSIGKKVADGYGRVSEWTVERTAEDCSWYARHERGRVLMRPLPIVSGVPSGLVGFRQDFGAACPPYWHPERYTEIVVPC